MERQRETAIITAETLTQKVTLLEVALVEKDAVICEKDAHISKLTSQLEAERFKYAQLQRLIFGSKRERFILSDFPEQMKLEFEPKSVEIEQAVEAERETIRIAYERKKDKKVHPGRLALPSHLPVVETIIEPTEDTTGMVCIGQEVPRNWITHPQNYA